MNIQADNHKTDFQKQTLVALRRRWPHAWDYKIVDAAHVLVYDYARTIIATLTEYQLKRGQY